MPETQKPKMSNTDDTWMLMDPNGRMVAIGSEKEVLKVGMQVMEYAAYIQGMKQSINPNLSGSQQ